MSRQPSPTHNRWYTEQYNTRRGLADEWVDDLLQQQWPAWSEAARATVLPVYSICPTACTSER